jgi:hypothetical protein
MGLPTTGNPLSFSQIQTEMGGANPISMSEYYANAASAYSLGISGIPNTGSAISISHFSGKFKARAPGLTYYRYDNVSSFAYPGTNNVAWFDTAPTPSATGTVSNISGFYGNNGLIVFGISGYGANVALKIFGYFRASETGTWSFNVCADDLCDFWIGSSVSAPTTSNVFIYTTYPSYSAGTTNTITLVQDQYYPILIYWGQTIGGGNFNFSFKPPSSAFQTDGTGFYFINAVIPVLNTIPTLTGTTSSSAITFDMTVYVASGTYPITWSATGFPTGVSINTSTGHITALQGYAANNSITVTATNTAGTASKTFTMTLTAVEQPPVSSGLVGYYAGETFSGSTWSDVSGNNNNATSSGAISKSTQNGLQTLYGGTSSAITFPAAILPTTYTLFHITKYNGGNQGRILANSDGNNWFSCHWQAKTGQAFHNGWLTDSVSNKFSLLSWVLSTDQNTMYRGNGYNLTTSPTGSGCKIGINTYSGEYSDWACACVIVYNRTLNESEITTVENWLFNRYSITPVLMIPVLSSIPTKTGDATSSSLTFAMASYLTQGLGVTWSGFGMPTGVSIGYYTGVITVAQGYAVNNSVTVYATNTTGTASQTFSIVVTVVALPALANIGTILGNNGNGPATIQMSPYLTSGTSITWSLSGNPSGCYMNVDTGAITVTMGTTVPNGLTLTATNSGGSASRVFNLAISSAYAPYDQGAYNIAPWSSGFPDTTARWLWNTAGAASSAVGFVYIRFQVTYNNPGSSFLGTLYHVCDNRVRVYQNNVEIYALAGPPNWNGANVGVTVATGVNRFDFIAYNDAAGPAGLMYSLKNSGGTVVMHSEAWTVSPFSNCTNTLVVATSGSLITLEIPDGSVWRYTDSTGNVDYTYTASNKRLTSTYYYSNWDFSGPWTLSGTGPSFATTGPGSMTTTFSGYDIGDTMFFSTWYTSIFYRVS